MPRTVPWFVVIRHCFTLATALVLTCMGLWFTAAAAFGADAPGNYAAVLPVNRIGSAFFRLRRD